MVCRGKVCGVEGANMAMGKENLEDIYAELLNSPVTSKTNYVQRDETKPFVRSFESYLSDTKTKSSPIRGEMDYFVSRSPEFGINISWVSSQTEGLTYDYCTFAAPDGSSQLYHAQLMVPEPLKMYPHRHDYFELVYVLSGRFQQTIGNQWVTMEQDDLLLLDTSTVHTEYIAEDGVVQYLQIPKAVMEAVFQEITRSKDLDEFFAASMLKQNSKYRYISYVNCGAYPRALLEQMLREKVAGEPGNRYVLFALLIRLMDWIGQAPAQRRSSVTKSTYGDGKVLGQLLQYLETNNWRVDRSAMERDLHYTESYLNKVLRKSTNMSLTEYCIEKRLEYAVTLLTTTSLSIGEIIAKCGYQNKTHFYRMFQEKYGKTPLEVRRDRM